MSYRTIVVGTDGSPTASVAVEVAQKLAKRLRGKLVLVGALDAYGVTRQPLQTALYEAAEAARGKKVDAIAELIEGTPGESILAAAIKHDADLIVVGNRGMGQATRFRLGSVPDWIAHDAPCDLLIVDTTGRAGPREPAPPYSRILAGTDGSGTATEAVRKAYTLASVYAGTVTLVDDYRTAASLELGQLYRARPMQIKAPSVWVDSIVENTSAFTVEESQRVVRVTLRVVWRIYDSGDAVDQRDKFVDGFYAHVKDNPDAFGPNAECDWIGVSDDPGWVPDWTVGSGTRPTGDNETYYLTEITLEGRAST